MPVDARCRSDRREHRPNSREMASLPSSIQRRRAAGTPALRIHIFDGDAWQTWESSSDAVIRDVSFDPGGTMWLGGRARGVAADVPGLRRRSSGHGSQRASLRLDAFARARAFLGPLWGDALFEEVGVVQAEAPSSWFSQGRLPGLVRRARFVPSRSAQFLEFSRWRVARLEQRYCRLRRASSSLVMLAQSRRLVLVASFPAPRIGGELCWRRFERRFVSRHGT